MKLSLSSDLDLAETCYFCRMPKNFQQPSLDYICFNGKKLQVAHHLLFGVSKSLCNPFLGQDCYAICFLHLAQAQPSFKNLTSTPQAASQLSGLPTFL